MRIGISTNTLTTINGEQKNLDGIGTYTFCLIDALKNKIDIKKILFKSLLHTIKHPKKCDQNDENVTILPSPIVSQYWPFYCYKSITNRIDLFHSTDYFVPKLKNIPVVATLHDAIMLKNPDWAGGKYRKLKNHILQSLISNANYVITISHAIKSDISEFWKIPANKISVIYHGMSESWFKSYHAEIKKAVLEFYNIHKPFYLIVGTLQPRKNIKRILAAFQTLPFSMQQEFMLVLVGNRGWLDAQTLGSMMRLQYSGQLKWLQHLSLLELQCLYQSAHLKLFPSLNEGFGFPILEGFASKTPVITSRYGATEEIAGKGAYLVDPESVENIAEAIKELDHNQELRKQLIETGYARAKEFKWERCAEETLNVYSNVLQK